MRHMLMGIVTGVMFMAAAVRAELPVPVATGYVTDQTGLIEPSDVAAIQILLGKYEVQAGRKISVLLVQATPDEELEVFADRVLQAWKMDGADAGAALLLWSADGYILIRAAGPMSERLGDEANSQILSRWVVPAFARGQAGTGIRHGVERMIAVVEGGEVGFPPAVPDTSDARVPAAEPITDDPPFGGEASVDTDVRMAIEPPLTLPPWFEVLPGDVARLAGGMSKSLGTGLREWLREAGDQLGQLQVVVPAMLLQVRGERVEPPFHAVSIGAGYAVVGLLALGALMIWGRAFTMALLVAALGGGVALWVATGFTALAGCLIVLGLLSPVLVPVLRSLLRGANDSEREPMPTAFAHSGFPVPRVAMRPGSAPRDKHVPRPLVATVHSSSRRDRKVEELVDLIKAVAQIRLRQLRPMHGVIALVLLVFSFPLAILGLLVVLGVLAYRDGIAFLLVDLGIAEPQLRERLKQHLPRPVIEGASGM